MSKQRVVIIGGGYAGMMTAIRLSGRLRRRAVEITLVNPRDRFVERIRLQEVSVGSERKAIDIPELLGRTGVAFVRGEARSVDRLGKHVAVATDKGAVLLDYDLLVLAIGSLIQTKAVEGVAEHAYWPEWEGPRGARALAQLLRSREADRLRIGVVGGGASGVELAGMISAGFRGFDVHLFSRGRIAAFKTPRVEAVMRDRLTDLGVALHDERPVKRIEKDGIVFVDGSRFGCDVIVWCGGLVAPTLAMSPGLETNARGQVLTDSYLRTLSAPDVYAVGDCAAPSAPVGAPLRMSVFTATVMGAHCADTLARHVQGRALRPFSFSYYGQGIALGGRNAVGFATIPDDQPVGPIYRRTFAYHLRNFFVWYLVACLRMEKRMCGSFYWLGKGRVRSPYSAHGPEGR